MCNFVHWKKIRSIVIIKEHNLTKKAVMPGALSWLTEKQLNMEQKVEETEIKDKSKDEQLAKDIHFAVEVESTFKLFSYRIIDQEQFKSRIDELSEFRKS
ncbi:hypothetical protein [Microviridae sp.]|nr:hypothetical protein [Microviridae sp.]